jgi:hypothetical protein
LYEVSAFRCGEKSNFVKRADVLLKPLVRDLGIDDGIRLAQVKSRWHILFQKPLSCHMSPSLLSGNELLLTVDSPVWLQELKFYQEDIIKKLASYQVRTIRFRLGRVNPLANQEEDSKDRKGKFLTEHDCSFIEETVSDIRDKELKETLQKTIAKAIAAGKMA